MTIVLTNATDRIVVTFAAASVHIGANSMSRPEAHAYLRDLLAMGYRREG